MGGTLMMLFGFHLVKALHRLVEGPVRIALQALVFRLRNDIAEAGGNIAAFDQLKEVRTLEYEVDFYTNKSKVRALSVMDA